MKIKSILIVKSKRLKRTVTNLLKIKQNNNVETPQRSRGTWLIPPDETATNTHTQ
jgi:hypothetical protein